MDRAGEIIAFQNLLTSNNKATKSTLLKVYTNEEYPYLVSLENNDIKIRFDFNVLQAIVNNMFDKGK